ncbi:hypothetical protein DTO164E3_4122 [Paecilomyces variotii]|nr:hypothetical protein DTO164E3_4122 [Paecilomyces variotii]KAJ9208350.1 hypothetical protein DTO032I3_1021 [Paecilomyces variotii]KAJ9258349.1 hypothetical protein DTO207G8_1524 [Paecilomyces variotii]KAJ9282196.1 hypothetical protein DTO021D3_948 [Paecilomyces variotii]KAJ9315016.1 hypothetical protein DTO271D3_4755 [Paecilomyces variotii]
MAESQDAALEEILWRSPPHVQMMGGYLHSNNILFYFAESPFFDSTSNNASLAIQASYNETFRHFVETREAFEGRLKTMQGLEFIVSYDPLQAAAQTDGTFAHEPSNIWVIRKQNRRKRPGMDDEVRVLSTYFIVGDTIYMAPSVASVVGNRLLSAVTSLTKLLNTASPLPIFSASYGHTYMPPLPKSTDAAQPQQSKENTPMPDANAQSKASLAGPAMSGTTWEDTRNLMESFSLLSKYGDEYMDENPLAGEPGNFILTRSSDATAARQQNKPATPVPGTIGRVGTPSFGKADAGKGPKAAEKEKEKTPSTPDGDNKLKRKKSRVGTIAP